MVAGLEEAAVSVVAGEEVGLGEGEADGLVVFGFEEVNGLEAGEAGESLDVAVVHGDGEGAAAGGLAGVDLADEAGRAGEDEVVGGEAGCGILPCGAHAALEGCGLVGGEGHTEMVRRQGRGRWFARGRRRTYPFGFAGRKESGAGMTNEMMQEELTPEERAKLKKQLAEQAVKLAVSGRWQEALQINREYVRLFPNEADGYNRIGKALSELGHVQDALDAYQRALDLDPTNQIAKRNIDRLAALREAPVDAPPTQVDTRLFVEETGTAAVASLQAVDPKVVAVLDAGDIVQLEVQGNAVNVTTVRGEYVGMVEPRIGLRLARMMRAGNRYSAAMVSTGEQPKVILRETFKHPSMIDKVSFPQSRLAEIRAYTRRDLLRRDEDEGWEYDEDEEVEEETEEGWSETGEDLDTTPDVDVEDDEEGFD